MGKFLDGWERARVAGEQREAEKHRRLEQIAAALDRVAEALAEDNDELARRNIVVRMEHGTLLLKRMAQPMAGVTFDLDKGHFKIHNYAASDGETETDAGDVDDCVTKLGEFAFSVHHER